MHAGLVRLLDLIRVNPQDTLLVDRFLILASDLEERSRVDATLGLSEALLRKNPRRAIELAHMVYKAKPGDVQPIELMVEGLENLGRYGKATVLRAELEKVRKAQQADGGSSREVTEASIMTIEKELKFLAGIEVPPPIKPQMDQRSGEVQKSVDLLPVPEFVEALQQQKPGRVEKSAPKDIPAFNPLQYGVAPAYEEPRHEDHSPPHYHQSAEPTLRFDDIGSIGVTPVQDGLPLKLQRTSVSHEDVALPPLMNDEEPKHRATQHSQASSDRMSSQVIPGVPMFHDMAPAVEDEEAGFFEEPSSEPQEFTPRVHVAPEPVRKMFQDHAMVEQQVLDRIEMLVKAHHWDEAWQLIHEHAPMADNYKVLALFREQNLARIDFRFMGWWLDALVFDRRPRYALVMMIDLLRDGRVTPKRSAKLV
jgi:hypothetical protein